ncbi:MAG: hypothetical protein ACHP9V_05855 [Terriglobales bacterium]
MLRTKKPSNPIGRTGRLSEKRLAKKLGGRQTPASGAMIGAKGDISFEKLLMEAKSTTNDSMSLKFEWLAKIAAEARNMGKTPALAVSFVTPTGHDWPDGDWVMVPMDVFKELFDVRG